MCFLGKIVTIQKPNDGARSTSENYCQIAIQNSAKFYNSIILKSFA